MAAWKRNSPGCAASGGCSCEAGCPVFSDDFNRVDNTNIGADYTEHAGTWDIASNQLQTTSANAIAYRVTESMEKFAASGVFKSYKVSVKMLATVAGAKARLIWRFINTTNRAWSYIELEFAAGANAATLRYVTVSTAQVHTTTQSCPVTAEPNTQYTVSVCAVIRRTTGLANSAFRFQVRLDDDVIFNRAEQANSAPAGVVGVDSHVGVGTGTTGGTVQFDDLAHLKYASIDTFGTTHDPECGDCFGGCCWPFTGEVPEQVELTIPAFGAFNIANCGAINCSTIPGTYTLTRSPSDEIGTNACVVWRQNISLSCGVVAIWAYVWNRSDNAFGCTVRAVLATTLTFATGHAGIMLYGLGGQAGFPAPTCDDDDSLSLLYISDSTACQELVPQDWTLAVA